MTESADMQYLHDQAEQMARQMTEMVDGLVQPFRELARNLNAVLEGLPSVEVTVPEALSGLQSTSLDCEGVLDPGEGGRLSRALQEVMEATSAHMELDTVVRIRIQPAGMEMHDGYYLEVTVPQGEQTERLVFVWDIDAQSLHHIGSRQDSPVSDVVDVRAVSDAVRTLLPDQD